MDSSSEFVWILCLYVWCLERVKLNPPKNPFLDLLESKMLFNEFILWEVANLSSLNFFGTNAKLFIWPFTSSFYVIKTRGSTLYEEVLFLSFLTNPTFTVFTLFYF